MKTLVKKQNRHEGSDFDDFLRGEGILEECEEEAEKYAFVMQLEDELKNLFRDGLAKC